MRQPSKALLRAPAPLGPLHETTQFDCGTAALTDWLREQAFKNEGRGSRTFVVCAGHRVVGYYALAAGAVERNRAPSNLARNMPDPIPVIIIGRLAVDQEFAGKGIGAGLLRDALKRALNVSREIAARAVLVHAVDDRAAGFYLHYEFRPFPADEKTLFFAMRHIAAVL